MTFNQYELITILNDKLDEAEARNVAAKFYEILSKYAKPVEHIDGITPVDINFMGKRNLAYEIKGCSQGYYVIFKFWSDSKNIDELDRLCRINEDILKFLTLKVSNDNDKDNTININLDEKSEQKEDHHPLGQNHYDYLFGYTDELKT